MDAKELKKYILENNLLNSLLEKIGCHSFIPYSNELRCALPNDNDNSKVSVFNNEEISVRIFTKGETVYGSIFDLIMFIDKCTFIESLKKCQALLGISSFNIKPSKTTDHLKFFKKLKKQRSDDNELNTYDKELLNRYSSIPHIDLIRDGVLFDVIKKYSIMFDERTNRIVFPHFKYNDKEKIVGIIGRTVVPAFKELNIAKYFPIDGYKFEKSKNIYGLSHTYEQIKRDGLVIVYESEKSVLKSDMYKAPFSVAVGSHELSSFQKKLLISLDVEIVIAFDKDVEKEHVLNTVNELNRFRKVSYIEDKWGLLREKDSPVDRGYKKFHFLLKHRNYL